MVSDKSRVAGIHKRVHSLRQITNVTLMNLVNAGYLSIDEDIVVRATKKSFPVIKGMGKKIVSARNLAKLFEEMEAPWVYKSLGIVEL